MIEINVNKYISPKICIEFYNYMYFINSYDTSYRFIESDRKRLDINIIVF